MPLFKVKSKLSRVTEGGINELKSVKSKVSNVAENGAKNVKSTVSKVAENGVKEAEIVKTTVSHVAEAGTNELKKAEATIANAAENAVDELEIAECALAAAAEARTSELKAVKEAASTVAEAGVGELKAVKEVATTVADAGVSELKAVKEVVTDVAEAGVSELKTVKSTLSNFTDAAIKELKSALATLLDNSIVQAVAGNNGTIPLPNIKETWTEGSRWKPRGYFEASNGQFADLRTLARSNNISLTHEDGKFIGSCKLGIAKAKATYDAYSLKYGIGVKGKISVGVDDLVLSVTIEMEVAGLRPKKLTLKELKIAETGKIGVTITGLGLLNRLTSKLASWLARRWKQAIVSSIENKLRENLERLSNELNF